MTTTDTRQSIQATNEDEAHAWLERADDHYMRAAELNRGEMTLRRAELELELAHYAKQRADELTGDEFPVS